MGMEEVEGIEGVGRGVMDLLWLWNCMEKSEEEMVHSRQLKVESKTEMRK